MASSVHSFSVYLDGLDGRHFDALEAAVCSSGLSADALLGVTEGRIYLDFEREAETEGDAVSSALKDVLAAAAKAKVTLTSVLLVLERETETAPTEG